MSGSSFPSSIPLHELTESQRKAVLHVDGPLLVLAGPGSGKTRVITTRIAALINRGIRPYNICAITFTNKAAEEMRERVLAGGCPAGVHVSTFHSLCVRILRQYARQSDLDPHFSIYDEADQRRCMKEAVQSCELDKANFSPSKMLQMISNLKNNLEDPETFAGRSDDYFNRQAARIYTAYQKILQSNNALDFDDLLLRTAFLLRDHTDVQEQLQNRFLYLLVDEYQDTNHAQYQIVRGLALSHGNICVAGDPDQSIYRWRGADIGNILAFEQDWPNATVVALEENFRSTPNILSMADRLIVNNKNRKAKVLIPTREAGSDPQISSFDEERSETEGVVSSIEELLDTGADPASIAVFYRVNSLSRLLEEAMIDRRIPYQVVRGVEFYSRKEIRDVLAYLKVLANPKDDVAFLRAIGTHPRGIGKTTLSRLAMFAQDNGISLYAALAGAPSLHSITPGARKKLKEFHTQMQACTKNLDGPVGELMEEVVRQTGYLGYLQSGGEKELAAVENVEELINGASRFDEQAEESSLDNYLQSIALYSDSDAYDSESPKVSLMTLHAAKGLEFQHVFITGVEDGLLPHERSMVSPDEMEEERRLFFVGITRAIDTLSISFSRYRTIHGQYLRTVPSQFLYEVGYEPDNGFDMTFSAGSSNELVYSSEDSQIPESENTEAFRPNELVEHKKFGLGRVKEFLNLGESSVVVVRFNSGKTKSLMLKYAKLRKVGDI